MKVSYSVESFQDAEGGMDYDLWKDGIPSLEEAVRELKEAECTLHPWGNKYWYITVQIEGVI